MATAAVPVQPLIFSLYFYFTKWHITNVHISEDCYVLVGFELQRFPRVWGLDIFMRLAEPRAWERVEGAGTNLPLNCR
jgi:hypothetical protein